MVLSGQRYDIMPTCAPAARRFPGLCGLSLALAASLRGLAQFSRALAQFSRALFPFPRGYGRFFPDFFLLLPQAPAAVRARCAQAREVVAANVLYNLWETI